MGSVLGKIACGLYLACMISLLAASAAIMKFLTFLPLDKMTTQGVALWVLQTGWRIAFFFAPWINAQCPSNYSAEWQKIIEMMDEVTAEHKKKGGARPPLFVLGNHSSFMDTILSVSKIPPSALWWARTYMAQHLYKLPILGTVCKICGHFPVYFSGSGEKDFKVDPEKSKEVDKEVDAHISRGGWIFFYPEGVLNPNPDELLSFRYGGMKKALAVDARLASMVFHGNNVTWPKKLLYGGFPAMLSYDIKLIAPKGAKAYVAELRENATPEDKELEDEKLLAKNLQKLMQAQYDALKTAPPHSSVATLTNWVLPGVTLVAAAFGFYQKFLKSS